ncbi:MAG: hypothetical protein AD742_05275 [Methylibium sp. NZG]|nr:MAG: hypothetical protein AD742_05275 [Methylibium sp. NZG]
MECIVSTYSVHEGGCSRRLGQKGQLLPVDVQSIGFQWQSCRKCKVAHTMTTHWLEDLLAVDEQFFELPHQNKHGSVEPSDVSGNLFLTCSMKVERMLALNHPSGRGDSAN